MTDAFKVVRDFEAALCDFTGAKYAVSTTSCTMALLLACKWHLKGKVGLEGFDVSIPKRTYVGVPMSIIHAGGRPVFRDEEWKGSYQLKPLPVWDSARWFTDGMCVGFSSLINAPVPPYRNQSGQMVCVSFHASKTLGDSQGGAILHDNPEADEWLRRARFDGRREGVAPKDETDLMIGWHCYLSPDVAARLLHKLTSLRSRNDPLPWGPGTNSDYPDLSQLECFK